MNDNFMLLPSGRMEEQMNVFLAKCKKMTDFFNSDTGREHEKYIIEQEKEQSRIHEERRFLNAKPSEGFLDCRIENFSVKTKSEQKLMLSVREFYRKITNENAVNFECLIILGPHDSGKTHIVTGLIRKYVNSVKAKESERFGLSVYRQALYLKSSDVLSKANKYERFSSRENIKEFSSASKYYEYIARNELTVIDNVARNHTLLINETAMLSQVIDNIKEKKHALILVSNLNKDGLLDFLGSDLMLRIQNNSLIVDMYE